ncbi:MAG: hypothetical protein C4530_18735 [Desulfobacteraceae bacterium]|nr:MAG: hypothetical protein C4530_18735 [Desulfobacteraceae bacterium]
MSANLQREKNRQRPAGKEPVSSPNLEKISRESDRISMLLNTGTIVSSVAHSVRNSLNAIKGAVFYLMGKYSEDETIREFMQIATDEINRIEESISDLITLSSHSSRFIETDINELIKKILFFTSFQFKNSNIKRHCMFGKIPAIRIRPFELGQAILNVLNNSIEAMGSGGVLSIKTYVDKVFGNEFIFLEITDSGPGIPPEKKLRSNLPIPTNEGKGFGLFITRKIIEDHGGNVLIESKHGVGTTVSFCLPVPDLGVPNEQPKK